MDPMTVLAIMKTTQSLINTVSGCINAIDNLKNQKPENVDPAALKSMLEELPDLTTLFPAEEEVKDGFGR